MKGSVKNMPIKAILFDWVGVLVSIKKSTRPSISLTLIETFISQHRGKDLPLEDVAVRLKLNGAGLVGCLDSYVLERFEKYQPLWNELPEFAKKYKLAVVNNGPSFTVPSFQRIFQFEKYGVFINSGIEGVRKPDPEIFHHALNRINIRAEEAIYLDDAPETPEVLKTTGIRSFYWKSQDSGFAELLTILDDR